MNGGAIIDVNACTNGGEKAGCMFWGRDETRLEPMRAIGKVGTLPGIDVTERVQVIAQGFNQGLERFFETGDASQLCCRGTIVRIDYSAITSHPYTTLKPSSLTTPLAEDGGAMVVFRDDKTSLELMGAIALGFNQGPEWLRCQGAMFPTAAHGTTSQDKLQCYVSLFTALCQPFFITGYFVHLVLDPLD